MKLRSLFLYVLALSITYSATADLLAGYAPGTATIGRTAVGEFGLGSNSSRVLARPFSTGASSYILESISFGDYLYHGAGLGDISILLYTDSAGMPGRPIVVNGVFNLFSANSSTIGSTLFPAQQPTLDANTDYWFVAWVSQTSGDTRYWWDLTTSTAIDSDVSGTDLPLEYAVNTSLGPGWTTYTGASLPMSIHGSVVPEPGTVALTGIGMGALWLTRRRRLKKGADAELPLADLSLRYRAFLDEERAAGIAAH